VNTDHVEAMIDYLLERYDLADTDSRALCLGWLQEAEQEAWGKGAWWFKEGRLDLALVAGTSEYSVSVRHNRIHAVEAGDGSALTRLMPGDFRHLVGAGATAAYPRLWCPVEPSSTGYVQVKVWPVPVEAGTLKAVYDRAVTTLADSVGSVSKVPADWRHLVLLRAEVYASLHLGQQGQAQGFMKAFEEGLAALRELNSAQLIRL